MKGDITKEQAKKDIEHIIKNFNWGKVQETMKALNWNWWDSSNPPTVPQMKKMVNELFKDTLAHLNDKENEKNINGLAIVDSWYVESGGFRVTLWDRKKLELSFIVDGWSSEGRR